MSPPGTASLSSTQIAKNMQTLIQSLHPNPGSQHPQSLLLSALRKRWRLYSKKLLACYDIPPVCPQDQPLPDRKPVRKATTAADRGASVDGNPTRGTQRFWTSAGFLFQAEAKAASVEQSPPGAAGAVSGSGEPASANLNTPRQFIHACITILWQP